MSAAHLDVWSQQINDQRQDQPMGNQITQARMVREYVAHFEAARIESAAVFGVKTINDIDQCVVLLWRKSVFNDQKTLLIELLSL